MDKKDTKIQKNKKDNNSNVQRQDQREQRDQRGQRGNFKKRMKRQATQDYDFRVLSIRMVSRTNSGGRVSSRSVAVAVGDKRGKIGVGTGNGLDFALALEKAKNRAQKKAVIIKKTKENGISSESVGKYCASKVSIRPAKGFIAGGATRTILELAGIQNINAKILSRSKNHLNNAMATIAALKNIK